jgi:hypothetical protein
MSASSDDNNLVTRNTLITIIVLLVFALICITVLIVIYISNQATVTKPTATQQDAIFTSAAQTVIAQTTSSAEETAIAMLTEAANSSPTPTATAVPPSATLPPPTFTSTPTETPLPVTPSPTPIPCNWAQFIKDVTVPDGSEFSPGTSFTKVWRLKNIGTCSWTEDYSMVFMRGSQMGGNSPSPLTSIVRPGETIDLSVDLIAPNSEGDYRGDWALEDDEGVQFGVGPNQDQPYWVKITVVGDNIPVFYFTDDFCGAQWRTDFTNNLACPASRPNFETGFVLLDPEPKLENGQTDNEPALVTHPDSGNGGFIAGQYPAIKILSGDHFKTVIGCMYGAFNCNITFQLNYVIGSGPVRNLGVWHEIYDEQYQKIDVDLSSLAGNDVEFILTVLNNGDSEEDWAFWLLPRIER